ncbi:Uncharacterised protein [Mycobacteroides abscessus subsp. abscessus]|nr:Uncharacterised protein [Mycobacteroides abscessus subsp. abscessus]
MMTLRVAAGAARRTASISPCTAPKSPPTAAPTSITMSISCAPAATASAASCALTDERCLPDGNPTTAATSSLSTPSGRCTGSIDGDTHTASTPRSTASATSARTSSGVASGLSRVWSMSAATSLRVGQTAGVPTESVLGSVIGLASHT